MAGDSYQNQTKSGSKIGSVTVGGLNFGRAGTSFADVAKYAVIGGLVLFGWKIFRGKK